MEAVIVNSNLRCRFHMEIRIAIKEMACPCRQAISLVPALPPQESRSGRALLTFRALFALGDVTSVADKPFSLCGNMDWQGVTLHKDHREPMKH